MPTKLQPSGVDPSAQFSFDSIATSTVLVGNVAISDSGNGNIQIASVAANGEIGTPATITPGSGDKGDTGDKGDIGDKGDTGSKGDTGAKGEVGDKGDTGSKGDTGAKGEVGDKGVDGVIGVDGAKGDTGAKGEVGDKGDTGSKGEVGDKGVDGVIGVDGAKGDTGIFNAGLTNTVNYTVTSSLANAVVFNSRSIVYSMYITNVDTTGDAAVSFTSDIRLANGSNINIFNKIPVPYRSAVEVFKKPKIFANGDAIQIQSFSNNVAANTRISGTVVFQTTADANYQGTFTMIPAASTPVDVYVSTDNPSVIESVLITNTATLGNVAVSVSIVDSSNVVQGHFASTLLVPVNSSIELCENSRRIEAGHKIQVTAVAVNSISVAVSAYKIV